MTTLHAPLEPGTELDLAAQLTAESADAGEDLGRCLELAQRWTPAFPQPGSGHTATRWRLLAAAATGDLTAARVLEPHLDALAILDEAGLTAPPGVWGVFAAEAPGELLEARDIGGRWLLTGTKPWCSLGGRLERALVTAHTPGQGDGRRLFSVGLQQSGVHARPGTWVARGLRAVDSGPVDFDAVPAEPVGSGGWYLARPGFAWGAMGVAACWLGGATALVHTLHRRLAGRDPDPVRALNLGTADAARFSARCALDAAAAEVDAGAADGERGALLAARVRAVVSAAGERILREVGHALGPAPLAFDEVHARRVADLEIYLRQHHGERDLADLGARVVAAGEPS